MINNRSKRFRTMVIMASAMGLFALVWAFPALADRATVAADAIWAHGELYGTVATVTSFKSPPPHSTDIIFSFMGSGLEGQRSVSETAPGDRDYNGGRWNVMAVSYTPDGLTHFDQDGDGMADFELTSAEMVLDYAERGYLEITSAGVYFVCPLRHQPQTND